MNGRLPISYKYLPSSLNLSIGFKSSTRSEEARAMKIIICTLALVAAASALPVDFPLTREGLLRTVNEEKEQNVDGSYQYGYETDGGQKVFAKSIPVPAAPNGEPAPAEQGAWEFVAPNGEQVKTSYVADENGFRPQGTHILPIPEAILRALEWNAAHPEEEAYWDAVYARAQPHSYYPVGPAGPQ